MHERATCPYCGATDCEAEFVHNGLGYEQVAPYACLCGALQIGPYDRREVSPEEYRVGWYAPPPPLTPEQEAEARARTDEFIAELVAAGAIYEKIRT